MESRSECLLVIPLASSPRHVCQASLRLCFMSLLPMSLSFAAPSLPHSNRHRYPPALMHRTRSSGLVRNPINPFFHLRKAPKRQTDRYSFRFYSPRKKRIRRWPRKPYSKTNPLTTRYRLLLQLAKPEQARATASKSSSAELEPGPIIQRPGDKDSHNPKC